MSDSLYKKCCSEVLEWLKAWLQPFYEGGDWKDAREALKEGEDDDCGKADLEGLEAVKGGDVLEQGAGGIVSTMGQLQEDQRIRRDWKASCVGHKELMASCIGTMYARQVALVAGRG